MNFRIFGVFVFCLLTVGIFRAQGQLFRNTVSFSGGYSLPVGKFAGDQLGDLDAGLAGSGYYGHLAMERLFTPWFGIRLAGSLNQNNTNADPVVRKANNLVDLYRPNITGIYTWETSVSKWQLYSMMLGPTGHAKIGKVKLMGHIEGGVMYVKSPVIRLSGTSSDGTNPIKATLLSDQNAVLGFGAGASVRIPLSEHLDLQFTGDWILGNAQLNQVSLTATVGNYPEVSQLVGEQKLVGVVNVGAGLAFNF